MLGADGARRSVLRPVAAEPAFGDEVYAVPRGRRVCRCAPRDRAQPLVPADTPFPLAAGRCQPGLRYDGQYDTTDGDTGPPARPRHGPLDAPLRRIDTDRRLPYRLPGRTHRRLRGD